LGDLGVEGRIKLKRILKKLGIRVWMKFIWLETGTNCGILWRRVLGSIKGKEFL